VGSAVEGSGCLAMVGEFEGEFRRQEGFLDPVGFDDAEYFEPGSRQHSGMSVMTTRCIVGSMGVGRSRRRKAPPHFAREGATPTVVEYIVGVGSEPAVWLPRKRELDWLH
jgi:hypothetical protein